MSTILENWLYVLNISSDLGFLLTIISRSCTLGQPKNFRVSIFKLQPWVWLNIIWWFTKFPGSPGMFSEPRRQPPYVRRSSSGHCRCGQTFSEGPKICHILGQNSRLEFENWDPKILGCPIAHVGSTKKVFSIGKSSRLIIRDLRL